MRDSLFKLLERAEAQLEPMRRCTGRPVVEDRKYRMHPGATVEEAATATGDEAVRALPVPEMPGFGVFLVAGDNTPSAVLDAVRAHLKRTTARALLVYQRRVLAPEARLVRAVGDRVGILEVEPNEGDPYQAAIAFVKSLSWDHPVQPAPLAEPLTYDEWVQRLWQQGWNDD